MKLSDIPADVRAEMDGKPAEALTFKEWWSTLPDAEQDATFGAQAAEAFRTGRMTQTELLRQTGRPLRPQEIAA